MGTRLAAYRNEIARLHTQGDDLCVAVSALLGHIARKNAAHAEETVRIRAERGCAACRESDDEVRRKLERTQAELAAKDEELVRTKSELAAARRELDRRDGRLKRYENSTTPGRHGYNEERAKTRAEEERMHAEENGTKIVENHKIGPPEGHEGAECDMKPVKTIHHEMKKCPCCGNIHLKRRKEISKVIIDFDGKSRYITVTIHRGHTMRCDACRATYKPTFPSIEGTSFGIAVLGHILEYACKKNTDADVAYYLEKLNGRKCSPNSIWNARKALAAVLAPAIRQIIEELKKAPYLIIHETPYPYKKKKAYVWVVRTDTATLVMPAPGRGGEHAPPFLHELRHMPVVVDGYVVYDHIFAVIQRCWAHILLKAEEAYIRCKDQSLKEVYKELHHRLANMHRRAKKIAKATAPAGGADIRTCLDLEREVLCMAAAYGDHGFATHLHNAAPHLFTFLRYPGMPSTNNLTEQDVRDAVVMQRKFRQKFVAREGMKVFSVLMSFHSTCRKLTVAPGMMFERMVESPGFDPISYGLSVVCPKALPPPPGYGLPVPYAGSLPVPFDAAPERGGVENRGPTPDLPVLLSRDLPVMSDTPPNQGVERTWGVHTTSEPDDAAAAPTVRPHRILVAMAITAATMCDNVDSPPKPVRPVCNPATRDDQSPAISGRITAPCGKPPPA